MPESYEEASGSEFFRKLHGELLPYAPADLIKAWLAWASYTQDVSNQTEEMPVDPGMFAAWECVLLAIRSDLGHRDGALGFGDLQRLYITDADNIFGPFKP
jgi:hypothetical protein